jgi:hypothetical protein
MKNLMPKFDCFDISKAIIQKMLTSTDLQKIKSIDLKLYNKLLFQLQTNQENFDDIKEVYNKKIIKIEEVPYFLKFRATKI